jgi:hypothetical protein
MGVVVVVAVGREYVIFLHHLCWISWDHIQQFVKKEAGFRGFGIILGIMFWVD